MKKKINLSSLKKLRFQRVLEREGAFCKRCGSTTGLSPSHIYPTGRYRRMAWELDNIIVLCWFKCHLQFWHSHPIEAAAWIKTVLPKERLLKLKKMSQNNNLPPINYKTIKLQYENGK